MIEKLARYSQPVLTLPIVMRVRRNHGLEHATIHMLSRRVRPLKIAGRADHAGFYLYGEAETDAIRLSVEEALERMRRGEAKWAVHPNCGTGLVTTSLMTSAAALLGLVGARDNRDKFNRLPLVMTLSILALIASQPLGLKFQEYFTTSGEPGNLEIIDITRRTARMPLSGEMTVHRVNTRNG